MQIARLTVAASLALAFASPSSAVAPPPKPTLELRTRVSWENSGVAYEFEIRNTSAEPLTVDTLKVTVTGVDKGSCAIEGPVPASSVAPRIEASAAGESVILWNLFESAIAPGAALTGLRIRCPRPPTIQDAFVAPNVTGYLDTLLSERLAKNQLLDNLEIKAIREARVIRVSTLAPGPFPPGTWEHWDRFQADVARAGELGWMTDRWVLSEVQRTLTAARAAAVAQDWPAMAAELQKAIDATTQPGEGRCAPEARDLVVVNARALSEARPPACASLLTLSVKVPSMSIGRTQQVTGRLINLADGGPIEGRLVTIQAPARTLESAVQMAGRTDASGEVRVSFTRLREGPDTLTAWTEPAPGATPPAGSGERHAGAPHPPCEGYGVKSAPLQVAWSGGPNLIVSFFVPTMLISAPGQPFYVSENVTNFGSVASSETTVRYYISTERPVSKGNSIPAGQRRVPPLKPGEQSTVNEGALSIPQGLPAGTYYLAAQVDPDNRVVELNKADNWSSPMDTLMAGGLMPLVARAGVPPTPTSTPPATPASLPTPRGANQLPWVNASFILPPRRGAEPPEEPTPKPAPTPLLAIPVLPSLGNGEFQAKRTQIKESVLKGAIGLLHVLWEDYSYETVTSDPKCVPIATLVWEGEEVKPGPTIPVRELHPLYVFEERGVSLLLPVVGVRAGFLEVVVDPVKDERVWVRPAPPRDQMDPCRPSLHFICLGGSCPEKFRDYAIDPFFLTGRGFRKLYSEPSPAAPWKILAPGATDSDGWLSLLVLEQRNGFLLVGAGGEIGDGEGRPLGWIPLRDEQGRLTVWIVFYWC